MNTTLDERRTTSVETPAEVQPPTGINFAELEKVIVAVIDAPAEGFSMWSWEKECGTVACAIGWYVHKHPESLLRLKVVRYISTELRVPAFGSLTEWDAVMAFFRLTIRQANGLFDGCQYENPLDRAEVAHRIRTFIDSGGVVP